MDIFMMCRCSSLQTKIVIAGVLQFMCGLTGAIELSVFTNEIDQHFNYKNQGEKIVIIKGALVGVILYFIISLILSTLIIIGGIKNNLSYVISPLSMACVNVVMDILYSVIYLTILYTIPSIPNIYALITWSFTGLISGVQFYLWMIIDSLYKKLMTEEIRYLVDHY